VHALSLLVAEGTVDPNRIDCLVLYNPSRTWTIEFSDLARAIRSLLQPADRQVESRGFVLKFLNHVLKLVGHEASRPVDDGLWVGSSFRGQVVLPLFLRTVQVPPGGFACLALFAGT
ncbi:hypothetical protein CLAIMM_02195, partial [Cladophialophora immunda]